MSEPRIRKASRIIGKTLAFREVSLDDAAFILDLRADSRKNQYLNPTSTNLVDQQNWLRHYQDSNDQAYFIIERAGQPVGTIRLFDSKGWSFGWGSWIVKDGEPLHIAIESALIIYSYGFDWLGFRSAHFNVRQANLAVCRFHDRFGAQRTGKDCLDFHYEIDNYTIRNAFQRYQRFLKDPIRVII